MVRHPYVARATNIGMVTTGYRVTWCDAREGPRMLRCLNEERGVQMRVVIQPVNPAFRQYVLQYVAELEQPAYTLVGTEGMNNTTYVFECDEENPWIAVDGLKRAVRSPPLGNAMFCQVAPYGMAVWPPIVDKDKYPRP